jgi:protein involved in polysaccharide export with SLBB domain
MKKNNPHLTRLVIGLLIFSMAFASSAPLLAASRPPGAPADYLSVPSDYPSLEIGPGDLLSITVVGYQSHSGGIGGQGFSNNDVDLPTDYMVDSDGKILFPFVGEVDLSGCSQVTASLLLMKKLSDYLKYPQVTVLIKSTNSYNVSVLGQVTHPGKFLIRGEATFLSSISEAGGPTEDADLGGAILIHHGKKTKLNLGKYLLGNDSNDPDPFVYPGDIIMVPKSGVPNIAEWAIIASIISSGVIVFSVLHNK